MALPLPSVSKLIPVLIALLAKLRAVPSLAVPLFDAQLVIPPSGPPPIASCDVWFWPVSPLTIPVAIPAPVLI